MTAAGASVPILVLNCGSSTVKFRLLLLGEAAGGLTPAVLARGAVDKLDSSPELRAERRNGAPERFSLRARDAGEAAGAILDWLGESSLAEKPAAVGHRVVHGGEAFSAPVLVTEETLAALEALSPLAPLHNPASLQGIRAAMRALGPAVPHVAVFDTAFHRTLPPEAASYPIPAALAARHGVRRFGFHGIAHQYLAERYAELRGLRLKEVNIVILHLGGGCSACAVKEGRSVDTSMGLTPLEGLMMGTRCGDVDPAIVPYLARKEGVGADQVELWLTRESGLLGVSGKSADMREVLAGMAAGDGRCRLAFSMFAYRAKKYLGAYLAALSGAGAVVLSGGIGENSPEARAAILSGMEWCGLALDARRNRALAAEDGPISADDSRIAVWVLRADEEALIARETLKVLRRQGSEFASKAPQARRGGVS